MTLSMSFDNHYRHHRDSLTLLLVPLDVNQELEENRNKWNQSKVIKFMKNKNIWEVRGEASPCLPHWKEP